MFSIAKATTALLIAGATAGAGGTAIAHAGNAAPAAHTQSANKPIGPDAPYDTAKSNRLVEHGLNKINPHTGTDFGHLPRWKQFSDGRVLLREDRVTMYGKGRQTREYTNVNPKLRSYWLSPKVKISVYVGNYERMTRLVPHPSGPYSVSRKQFLDSFNPKTEANRYLRYVTTYKVTFDSSHTTITGIQEVLTLRTSA